MPSLRNQDEPIRLWRGVRYGHWLSSDRSAEAGKHLVAFPSSISRYMDITGDAAWSEVGLAGGCG